MSIRPYKGIAPTIATTAYIDPAAVVIGDVHVGADSSTWPMCAVRGDGNSIRIGARTNLQDGTMVHATHRHIHKPEGHSTIIGSDVTVGHNVVLHGCQVEDRCLVGMDSVILDGAVLRSHVYLGAGSLVPEGRVLDGGYLWLGRPARRVRELTEKEWEWFEYSAQHYVRLKNDYL